MTPPTETILPGSESNTEDQHLQFITFDKKLQTLTEVVEYHVAVDEALDKHWYSEDDGIQHYTTTCFEMKASDERTGDWLSEQSCVAFHEGEVLPPAPVENEIHHPPHPIDNAKDQAIHEAGDVVVDMLETTKVDLVEMRIIAVAENDKRATDKLESLFARICTLFEEEYHVELGACSQRVARSQA